MGSFTVEKPPPFKNPPERRIIRMRCVWLRKGRREMLHAYTDRGGPYDVASFKDFLEGRPDGERWELVDGYALQSASPRIGHQRIASNFERHLNELLSRVRPEWRADREIGIEVSRTAKDRPEPEVTVIDKDIDPDQNYAERFYLVMEVPSASDRGQKLKAKVGFYKSHPDNLFVVVVEQDEQSVVIHRRMGPDEWAETELNAPSDELRLEGLGTVCTLEQLYANTRFDPRSYPQPAVPR